MGTFLGLAWENVAIGLLGGAIVSGFSWWLTRLNDWRLQRRFPLAGTYLTRFEDEEGGNSFMATAPAVLTQRGRRITGTTQLGDREWVLEGQLSDSGYIHGIYSARDPIDRGVGNFFLRVGNDRTMDGLWSGFDSVNGKVTSGRYLFRPELRSVVVRPAHREDLLEILRLADAQLGTGYVDEGSEHFLEEPGAFGFVAVHRGQVIGFALCAVCTPDEAISAMRVRVPLHIRAAEQVGVLKTAAVDERYLGQGVGSMLVTACLDRFQADGVRAVYAVAWKSGDRINIGGVLRRHGFVPAGEVENYWKDASMEAGFSCPVCGQPPCTCSAVIFTAVLSGTDEGHPA